MEYGEVTTATKQAPARFAFAEAGTEYTSLEGVHTLQPNSVLMVDSQGNLYQNTLENLIKRNEFSKQEILGICASYLEANPTEGVTQYTLYESLTGKPW